MTRNQLRQAMRIKRQQLTIKEQEQTAQQLLSQIKLSISKSLSLPKAIAIYLANDGELNTRPTIDWFWQQNIDVYLPVIHPFSKGHLLFLRYQENTPMLNNKYGIAEPKLNILNTIKAQALDIIYTPLVAFDDRGNRLGMGGGFYDRTLTELNNSSSIKTSVIGLAHDCQKLRALPVESWDIPLPEIITPSKHHKFTSK